MSPLVLLLTHAADHTTVDWVADALLRRGAQPLRVDTDRFPLDWQLGLGLEGGDDGGFLCLQGRTHALEAVQAVWLRQLLPPALGDAIDERYRASCVQECRHVLRALWDRLEGARWVNGLAQVERAGAKLRQLRLAREAGLRVPDTLCSNDPAAVRAFHARQPRGVVMKMQTVLAPGMRGGAGNLYTTVIESADLQDDRGLALCPPLFQERIAKAEELRVIAVDGHLFCGAIRPQAGAGRVDDWRPQAGLAWMPAQLPEAVAARFLDLMRRLGLRYGAADFIHTPDDDWVFLEVNACGEWGMLQRELGLPIADALADALLADAPVLCAAAPSV
ncbi:MvdC family ATP-grasp ribosomal peptide maturase [Mitsuaria sp. WAJ17]|uniref:MvdC/MvdD family ATP grasp protein n=1 Tax=Mitsuaria sp. WAJ17 TaxID=2761452 RepID=UPI0016020145|nr:MvdC family ATP-grasp ribosomal peptide maturase [Mitsuaria sp. WAJ17]MBB2486974.1 MvdC family ATP-grasp ribosomal peptide maturase [Mitsuaria sp. WAJ17]